MDFNKYVDYVLENDEELKREYQALEPEYLMIETMIRAANKCDVKYSDLLNAYEENGLMAIYNLGMEHMYEYLKGKENEKTI